MKFVTTLSLCATKCNYDVTRCDIIIQKNLGMPRLVNSIS